MRHGVQLKSLQIDLDILIYFNIHAVSELNGQ